MASQVLWANNALTTLAATVTNSQTSISVTSGSGSLFPSPASGQFFAATLISASNSATFEIVYCTARTGDALTVQRAREGTTALAFNAGDLVQNLITSSTNNQMIQWSQVGSTTFTSNGTFTVPPGVQVITVQAWGGGAGGGGGGTGASGAGGGGGGFAWGIYTVTPGQTIAVAIGAAGTGGNSSGTNGTGGGATTVGGLCSATGGTGGTGGPNGTGYGAGGGTGGSGSGGTILNINGQSAPNSYLFGTTYVASAGGGTFGGSNSFITQTGGGMPATYGCAGSGGANGYAGSNGLGGLVIISW